MAVVAVDAVVNVPAYARMPGISFRLQMAIRALEYRIGIRIRVAGGTNAVGSAVVQREVRVIKRCSRPRGCGVAGRAGRREAGGHVVWIRRGVIGGLVARVAIRRNRCVIVVHVTTRAGYGSVRARQWERGVVVVKRGRDPCRCVVANIARLREA